MSYTITPPEGFGLLKAGEKSQSWTPGGQPVPADDARIILTRSGMVFPPDENHRRVVPEQTIRGLDNLANVVMLQTTPVSVDGMPGYESRAKAIVAATKTPVKVYCAALFAGDGTFYVLGYDGGEDASASIDLFQAAAQTLTVK